MPVPQITCLFHNSATVPALLCSLAGRTLAGDLLVECSSSPTLGFVLNLETPANYPGVAGLLGGIDLATLAHPSEHLPSPIILAPGSPVGTTAVRSALALFCKADDRLERVTFLVPVSEARSLGATLALGDRYAIAWDVTAFPHEELLEFGRWLAAEHLVDRTNFAGVFAYAAQAPDPNHAKRIGQMLASLGDKNTPIDVIVTGP